MSGGISSRPAKPATGSNVGGDFSESYAGDIWVREARKEVGWEVIEQAEGEEEQEEQMMKRDKEDEGYVVI
jgi:hypothetical protein